MLTPERWQIVERLFHEALACPPADRPGFIASSTDDPEVRREVESLLAAESEGDSHASLAAEVAADWASSGTPSIVGRDVDGYRVLSRLGAGGMGEVYLAEDLALGRQVALKLLAAPFSGDAQRLRRFTEEARAASALNHPNIITVHQIGEFEGRRFIATEFIDGGTLRERMTNGPLPIADALDVAAQVASALAAAHQAGIVHRDIKPENIMVRRDGYVKVLDFGLAKLGAWGPGAKGETPADRWDRMTPAGGPRRPVTRTGMVVGTPHYMAPEQATGGVVDTRADLFSLGVVLHEMLTGARPAADPAGVQETDASGRRLSADLVRLVGRSLAMDPAARYQTAEAFKHDLASVQQTLAAPRVWTRPVQWAAAGFIAAAAAAVGLTLVMPDRSGPNSATERSDSAGSLTVAVPGDATTLAVLPFQAVGVPEDIEGLGVGMADAIITQLGSLPQLGVRPTSSIMEYVAREVDPVEIGRKLRVDHVLAGLIQQSGDRIRITVQLVDVETGVQRWADRLDERITDLFALQDTVSQQVAAALIERVTGDDRARLLSRQTTNDEAYRLYVVGRYHLNRGTAQDLEQSVELFTQAVALDPRYALAYASLATAHRQLGSGAVGGRPPDEAMPVAREWAMMALAIDDEIGEAHLQLANINFQYEWNWEAAEAAFRRAIALSPNSSEARRGYGWFLAAMGRAAESLEELRRARELDPVAILTAENYGVALFLAGRYDDALLQIQEANALDPSHPRPYTRSLSIFEHLGRFEQAVAARQAAWRFAGEAKHAEELGQLYAEGGYDAMLQSELQSLLQRGDAMAVASTYAGLGERDRVIEFLERAYQERHTWIPFLKVDPQYASLRGDPRFIDLLERIGLL